MSESPRRLRRVLAKTAMLLASVAVTIAVLEVATRFFYTPLPPTIEFFRLTRSDYYQADVTVGWRPRPNITARHVSGDVFDTTFTTNSRGLRDREHSIEKPPGTLRVVVLGDSFAWGYGVNDDVVFPRLLESQLAGVEVINLGVAGYGLRQEFAYLKLEGMRYEPDLVILALCMNDLSDLPSGTLQPASPASHGDPDAGLDMFRRLKAFLNSHSALYSFVISRVNTNRSLIQLLIWLRLKGQLAGYEELDINLRPALRRYPSKLEGSFADAEDQLRMIRDYLRAANVQFLVALLPSVQAVDHRSFQHTIAYTEFGPDDFDLERPYRRLIALGEAEGIPMVHPLPLFRERHAAGRRLFIARDMHFNPEGHGLFAASLSQPIKTLLDNPPQRPTPTQESGAATTAPRPRR